jgi:hypothetical protein
MPVILATWEADIERIEVLGQSGHIACKTPSLKLTRAKWTGSMTQAVEWLLCKHKALNSNFSPIKKKNFKLKKTTTVGIFGFIGK